MPRVKALILANRESRDELSSITGREASQTISVANRPLVDFALSAVRDAGIEEVAVLVSSKTRGPVRGALAEHGGPERVWIETAEPLGFEDSLLAAADFLAGAPFLVHSGDAIVLQPLRPLVDDLTLGPVDALLLGDARAPGPPQGLRTVSALPEPDALAGVQLFGPRALDAAAVAAESPRGPLALARALQDAGGHVEGRRVRGSWRYEGTIDHLLEANRMVLDDMDGTARRGHADGIRIEGRVSVHPSATVERSTVRGPAVIGAGAVLRDAFVGPYSAIGRGVMIEGAEIEHSIVLSGATIRHPGRRVEASIVGEGAVVSRDFGLPSSLRLRVGEGTEVWLA